VYIMTNRSGTLYTGVTNDLKRRVYEHKHKLIPGFTSKYAIDRLVYFDSTPDVRAAIAREKQIKKWRREKKVALIESKNRNWKDLSAGWFDGMVPDTPASQGGQRQQQTARFLDSLRSLGMTGLTASERPRRSR